MFKREKLCGYIQTGKLAAWIAWPVHEVVSLCSSDRHHFADILASLCRHQEYGPVLQK